MDRDEHGADADAQSLARNRDFQRLWVGSAISALGSRVSALAYPLLVLALTGSAADAGLVGFAATIAFVVFQLPAGVLVDRWDRRRVMLACDAGRALALASVAIAVYADRVVIAHLIAAAFIEGTLTVFGSLCEPVALQRIVPEAQRLPALSALETRSRIAALLGQPLGGLMFGLRRWLPFVVDLLSYVVSFVAVLGIRRDLAPARPPDRANLRGELVVALGWLWRQRALRILILLIAGSNLVFQVFVLTLLVVAERQAASAFATGLMLAGAGLGGVLGALAAPRLRERLPLSTMTIGANWLWALAMPIVAWQRDLIVLGAVFAVMAFVGANWNVAMSVYRLEITPAHMLGRIEGALSLVSAGALPLGSLIGGLLLEHAGLSTTIGCMIGAMLVLACVATYSLRPVSDAAP